MSEWKTIKLGELYDFKNGVNFNKNQKGDKGILTIDVLNMYSDNHYVDLDNLYRVDKNFSDSYFLKKGDILFVRSSVKREGVGWVSLFLGASEPVVFCGFIIRARPIKSKMVDSDFLIYLLRSRKYREIIINRSKQSTITNISQDNLFDITIDLPPIEEQKRIVEILDKAFEGIAQAEANTRRNLINARELFDSYLDKILTDCRWETKQISECFRVKSGNFLPKNKMNNFGEFKVYGGNGVAGQHDQFNLEGKNILIGRVGAKCGNIKTINAKIWLTDNALYISEFLVDFDLDFLSFVLERADLGKTANQTAQPVISYTTIKSVFISYPKATEQQKTIVKKVYKIKDCLQDLEKIYQRKLEAIAELKQSILEKAFTGQLSQ
ncbi:restriction endonuclease subunit S [Microcystis aeruginosa]|uniref:Type 1 restriction-modification system specificity subunit n=1 Tax=Microcystis aeruginosa NIES-3807 TaxID=2517785 RepID=A0AAD3B3D9_MICAE|nr:restriction endonuclease subunit S [Microcystis aeruginosa]GCL60478.1 type 1 restriction-modification system specificity subunit [Microcystis aeruginosa NIES-3807]